MLEDGRRGVVILLSHCILNTNSICYGSSIPKLYPAMVDEIVEALLRLKISIIQLTCPEQVSFGLDRRCMDKSRIDNPTFREHCRALAKETVEIVDEYLKRQYRVIGFVGRRGSPSCGVEKGLKKGVFIEEFERALKEGGREVPLLQYDRRDVVGLVEEIKELSEKHVSPSL